MHMALVFFDIDKTVLSINSASSWVKREYQHGYIGFFQLSQAMVWLLQYRMGWADLSKSLRKAIASHAGVLVADIEARTDQFWDETISESFRPLALERINQHREAGDTLVLLSSTSQFIAERVAAALDIQHVLCTRLLHHDGVLTGEAAEPLCFGAGKSHYAKKLSAELDLPLASAVFYTDSISDLAALEIVGHPVVVCPDGRLRKEADLREWPIEMW